MDIIDELTALSDADLGKKLGFEGKVQQFKKDLAEAATLKPDGRAKVVAELTKILAPDNWELQDLHRTVERAKNPKQDAAKFLSDCGCIGD